MSPCRFRARTAEFLLCGERRCYVAAARKGRWTPAVLVEAQPNA